MRDIIMISSLMLISTSKIKIHEACENLRLQKIYNSILREGFLRHPVLVVKMKNDEFLLIDGAHRFQALHLAGYNHIPVQVIHQNQVQLTTWIHEVAVGAWLYNLRLDSTWIWKEKLDGHEWTAFIRDEDGKESWLVPLNPSISLIDRLHYSHKIVNAYMNNADYQRLSFDDGKVSSGSVKIRYATWLMDEIEDLTLNGYVLPSGTTQFIIQERLLNLRIPLTLLANPKNEDNSWEQLKRTWSSSLRHYSGSVYLYEGESVKIET